MLAVPKMTYKLKEGDKLNHCHTCRRQRLRCDGKKPTCQKCVTRGVECLGYAAQPLLWVQPKSQNPAQAEDKSAVTSRSGGRKKGRPKLVLMASADSEESSSEADSEVGLPNGHILNVFLQELRSRGFDDVLLQKRNISILRGLDPAGYNAQRFIIESLKYYDDYLCSDMVLVDAPDNPYRIPIELWNYIPDLLMDPIIAASTVHKLVRIQSTSGQLSYSPHNKPVFRANHLQHIHHPLLQHVFTRQHRQTKALAGLVAEPQLHANRALLEAVVTAMLCEMQQSSFGDWNKHLNGAKAIIAARGGFAQLAKEISDEINYELSLVMQVDIMRDVGASSPLLHLDSNPLQYLEHVETIYQDGTACLFPCPNEMLTALILTNDARHKLYCDPQRGTTALAEHTTIIHSIQSFSPSNWADKQFSSPRLGWKFTEAFSPQYTKEMVQDLAQTFQLAALLYSIRTLFLDQGIHTLPNFTWSTFTTDMTDGSEDTIYLKNMETQTVQELLVALRKVWALEHKAPAWFGKFTLWPLFMAGMSMDANAASDEEKAFVCNSLSRICYHMGNFTPRDAVWAIQHVWDKAGRFERGAWLEDLPQEPLPGLFFA